MFRHKLADIVTGVQEMFRDPEEEMAQERMITSVGDMQLRAEALDKGIKSLTDKHINALRKKDYKIETLEASRAILMQQCSADANEKLKLKGMLDESRDELGMYITKFRDMERSKNTALNEVESLKKQLRILEANALEFRDERDSLKHSLELANEAREDAEKELHEMESQKNLALVDAEILRCELRDKEKMLDRAFIDISNHVDEKLELKKKLDKALIEIDKWATGENY